MVGIIGGPAWIRWVELCGCVGLVIATLVLL